LRPADRREAALRWRRTAARFASNEAFTGWSKTFTGPRLCAAIVDRLVFNATLIETGTESYRLARTKGEEQRDEGAPHR
jgi:DNA replication protein DnaC